MKRGFEKLVLIVGFLMLFLIFLLNSNIKGTINSFVIEESKNDISFMNSCFNDSNKENCSKADFDKNKIINEMDFNFFLNLCSVYDLNNDSWVTRDLGEDSDFEFFRACFLSDTENCTGADFDKDGYIGIFDFELFSKDFATCDLNWDGIVDLTLNSKDKAICPMELFQSGGCAQNISSSVATTKKLFNSEEVINLEKERSKIISYDEWLPGGSLTLKLLNKETKVESVVYTDSVSFPGNGIIELTEIWNPLFVKTHSSGNYSVISFLDFGINEYTASWDFEVLDCLDNEIYSSVYGKCIEPCTIDSHSEFCLNSYGGSAENALLIIDPTIPESLYIGNYYKNARNIPDKNVLYMDPSATNFTSFININLNALSGELENKKINDHIDYIIIASLAPTSKAYGIEGASDVNEVFENIGPLPVTTAYSYAFVWNESDYFINQYGYSYKIDSTPFTRWEYHQYPDPLRAIAFDNSFYWTGTKPSKIKPDGGKDGRYYISSLLSYTGIRGNTLNEIINMIDRSVEVDGTRPNGTFYFLGNGDVRTICRFGYNYSVGFEKAVSSITDLGGNAEFSECCALVPSDKHDILGVMTGHWLPGILTANMTIQPGAFADHLTSYAGILGDITYAYTQEPMTNWIARGASGTAGAVTEPGCSSVKFPNIFIHASYYEGLSLGEAFFRSVTSLRHTMFFGDPLTRPFGYLPVVSLNLPNNTLSGIVNLVPSATTDNPNALISHHNIYVDGISKGIVFDGNSFDLDTTLLSDGFHDIRVVSYDNSNISTPGRWIGQFKSNNYNKEVNLTVSPIEGDLSTIFNVVVDGGKDVSEIRILQNNVVIASTSDDSASFEIPGFVLGGANVKIIAEAEFKDSIRALSEPKIINISYRNKPTADAETSPKAFSYTKDVLSNKFVLVELPAIDLDEQLTYTILKSPTQSKIIFANNSMPNILIQTFEDASGIDTMKFRVDGLKKSSEGIVRIRYKTNFSDNDNDGVSDEIDCNDYNGKIGNCVGCATCSINAIGLGNGKCIANSDNCESIKCPALPKCGIAGCLESQIAVFNKYANGKCDLNGDVGKCSVHMCKPISCENSLRCSDKTDKDNDGVPDAFDKCNNSLDKNVNEYGFPRPKMSKFENDLTTNVSYEDFGNISNFNIGKLNTGKIKFKEEIKLFREISGDCESLDFDSYITITENKVKIASENLEELNKSAEITIYNVIFNSPYIERDGVRCDECKIISYINNTLIFSVEHFTEYEVKEDSSQIPLSSGGGSSGNKNNAENYNIKYEEFKKGYTNEFSKGGKISFEFGKENHLLEVMDLTKSTIKIKILSEPQEAIFLVGNIRKFDLNNDAFYDLNVRLNSIYGNKANLTIQTVNEDMTTKIFAEEKKKEETAQKFFEEEKKNNRVFIWSLIIILIIFIVIYLIKNGEDHIR
ncbi:MAG: hypothetical protein AABX88_01715 [Nanoarchaeota archaeon]